EHAGVEQLVQHALDAVRMLGDILEEQDAAFDDGQVRRADGRRDERQVPAPQRALDRCPRAGGRTYGRLRGRTRFRRPRLVPAHRQQSPVDQRIEVLEHVRIGRAGAEAARHAGSREARRAASREQRELEGGEIAVADPAHAARGRRRRQRPVDAVEQPRQAVSAARDHHRVDVVRARGPVDLLDTHVVGRAEALPAVARRAAARIETACAQPFEREVKALERQVRARRRDDLDAPARRHPAAVERASAKRTNQSIDAGFAIESRLTDRSTECPSRIFFTGTSSFLPDIVRGTSGIAYTSFGTCRAESFVRMASSSRVRSAGSTPVSPRAARAGSAAGPFAPAPEICEPGSRSTMKSARNDSRPRYSMSMTSESATSSNSSTTRYSSLVPIRIPWRLIVESERPKIVAVMLSGRRCSISQSPWRQTFGGPG